MGIQYLLWLQEIAEGLSSSIENFFIFICGKHMIAPMFLIPAVIYWIFDKKTGERILMAVCLGNFLNGFLKIMICCDRPWIRDSRIHPSEKAMADATGYSFPSGHSTLVVSSAGYGGWLARKKYWWLTALCWFYCFLILFSRNYLRVHTPQDVLGGLLVGIFSAWLAEKLIRLADDYEHGKTICLIAALLLTVVSVMIIQWKPYPMNYMDGKLLVDPAIMRKDSFLAAGVMGGMFLGWYLERKYVNFAPPRSKKEGVMRLLIGFMVLLLALALGMLVKKAVPVSFISDTILGGIICFSGSFAAPKLFVLYAGRSDPVA